MVICICVIPMIDWQTIEGVPWLSAPNSWDQLQHCGNPELGRCKKIDGRILHLSCVVKGCV